MSQIFTLFGKNYEVSEERLHYNFYRNQFTKIAEASAEKFVSHYMENADNLSQVVNIAENYGNQLFSDALKATVKLLISKGIYEIDSDTLIANAVEKPVYFKQVLDSVKSQVHNFEEAYRKSEAARQAQINSASSSWSGGGHGIEGALKGAAEAAVLNMASGAITKAVTSGAAKQNLSAKDQKIYELLNNQNTAVKLAEGLYKDIFCMVKTFVSILAENQVEPVENIPEEEISKSVAIYHNLKENLYEDAELTVQMWMKLLTYYPYDVRYFTLLLEQENDNLNEILTLADVYHIPMNQAASALLESRYQFKGITDLQEAQAQKEKLLDDMQKYHIEKTPLLTVADERIHAIMNDNCTYKGISYNTEEERNQAEALDNALAEQISGVERNNLLAMTELYISILSNSENVNYSQIKQERASELNSLMIENIQNYPENTKEILTACKEQLESNTNTELNQPILKALNAKIGKLNFSEKKDQLANNISGGLSNISNGLGGLFKKK